MIYTTLNRIREHRPCGIDPRDVPLRGYQKLAAYLGPDHGPDAPVSYQTILDSNGLEDALWCLRAEPQHASIWRMYAVRCARRVQHLMTDPRSIAALDVAEQHARGQATDDELAAARDAAGNVELTVPWAAAWDTARDAAWDAAGDAAWDAALVEARAAAGDAARAAAAWAAARDAAWDAMTADFSAMLNAHNAGPGESCQLHDW